MHPAGRHTRWRGKRVDKTVEVIRALETMQIASGKDDDEEDQSNVEKEGDVDEAHRDADRKADDLNLHEVALRDAEVKRQEAPEVEEEAGACAEVGEARHHWHLVHEEHAAAIAPLG